MRNRKRRISNRLITTIFVSLSILATLIIIIVVLDKNDYLHLNLTTYKDNTIHGDDIIDTANKPANQDISQEDKTLTDDDKIDLNSKDIGNIDNADKTDSSETPDTTVPEPTIIPEDVFDTITISTAGDVTLGRDENYGYEKTFDHELVLQNNDYGYFFKNVKDIFEADDLTIVNLETTLTTANKKADKRFRFKADPSYVEILKQGNIEAVSLANNHTYDYLEEGYNDTITNLVEADIGLFGYDNVFITEIRDIKIGALGYNYIEGNEQEKEKIKQVIEQLNAEEDMDLVIVMFHWGVELDNYPNSIQKNMAHMAIDSGADLVLGSHPHVLQGIEEYSGKQIVYSLGNFCFGGNKNPRDKDSMIYIQNFNFKNGKLISQQYEIIPCSISSVSDRNNYQPTPLLGKEAERVMNKIEKFSDF